MANFRMKGPYSLQDKSLANGFQSANITSSPMSKPITEQSLTAPRSAWECRFQILHSVLRHPVRFLRLQKQIRDHRCIFVHIPKCAGTSIRQSLFGTTGGHRTLLGFQSILPREVFDGSFKFTFVRNPWDRLASAFFFLKNRDLKSNEKWAKENLSQFDTFDSFVRGWVTRENIWTYSHFRPQYHFIRLEGKKPAVDFIGFYENLRADFSTICARLKSPAQLREENRNSRRTRDYREHYTDETRRIVAEVYAEDVELFGYSFDNSSLSAQIKARDHSLNGQPAQEKGAIFPTGEAASA
jgi:hypothetical protein